ncbi:MAG: hypothetical protein ACO3NK_07955, partial [Prochlorotrichaceae cyanobacterium]
MTIVSSGLTTDSTTGPGTPSSADQRSQYLQNLLTIAQSGPDLGQVAPVAQVESSALQTLQGQAAARLRELAIPSTREEDWRFTD